MLLGKRVVLKLLKKSFFTAYFSMFSPAVQQALGATRESEEKYLERELILQDLGLTFFYCVFLRSTDQLVGAIEIRTTCDSQLYCWLNEKYWGKGLFKEAIHLVATHYFARTGRSSFTAHVAKDNEQSYRALKKCGFIKDTVALSLCWRMTFYLRSEEDLHYVQFP